MMPLTPEGHQHVHKIGALTQEGHKKLMRMKHLTREGHQHDRMFGALTSEGHEKYLI